MIIIIPIAGSINFRESDFVYPKPLIDIDDKPLIEYVINNFSGIEGELKFCFILKQSLCTEFNLDYVLTQLTSDPIIIRLKNQTKGATCSVLMAIDKIPLEEEVIIANSDQIFLENINNAISFFRKNNADGGIITFKSVHPRWSFAIIDEEDNVLETAEKRPISKNAIAGFYYFQTFNTFIKGAFNSVLSEDYYNDQIYLSSTMNQLVLQNKSVKAYKINNDNFFSFYTPQKIKEFERQITGNKFNQ
jgi:NDP-sugar pyrophosphorylase family protein